MFHKKTFLYINVNYNDYHKQKKTCTFIYIQKAKKCETFIYKNPENLQKARQPHGRLST